MEGSDVSRGHCKNLTTPGVRARVEANGGLGVESPRILFVGKFCSLVRIFVIQVISFRGF